MREETTVRAASVRKALEADYRVVLSSVHKAATVQNITIIINRMVIPVTIQDTIMKRAATSQDSKVVISQDLSKVVTSQDLIKVVISQDSKVVTSQDSKVVTSQDSKAAISQDLSRVVTSQGHNREPIVQDTIMKRVATSQDLSRAAIAQDLMDMATIRSRVA